MQSAPLSPTETAGDATVPPVTAVPTTLSKLLARERTLDELGPEARARWSRLRTDLDQPFWADKYSGDALADSQRILTGFLADDSRTTLGEVEKSLDKLSTALLPSKAPAELEKSFWQRVGEARHACYLVQLAAILKAAEVTTEHALAKAEFGVLDFATKAKAVRNQRIAKQQVSRQANLRRDPVFTPPAAHEAYHGLSFTDRARMREQIRTGLDDIDRLPRRGLSDSQATALNAYLRALRAYTKDRARPADLGIAAAGLDLARSRRSTDRRHPADSAWRCVVLDARNTAVLAQQLGRTAAPPTPPRPDRPADPAR